MRKYKESEKINSPKRNCYNGDKFGGYFRKISRPYVLQNAKNNFYSPIYDDVLKYFKDNNMSWWGGKLPTGHILSSQIACLNHLFPLRKDRDAVLSIAKTICPEIEDVLKIGNDTEPAYISFEVVSDKDYLNEIYSTRGSNCTSVDALIVSKIKGKTIMLPIEWKYTEFYNNTDKSTENSDRKSPNHKKGDEAKGKERLERYCYNDKNRLIDNSKQLKSLSNYRNSVYFFEPFYQLMRQTLWTEQVIANKTTETIKADDFIHVHVIPSENKSLLQKKYKCSNKNMEETWRDCLQNQEKYKIISPKDLLKNVDKNKYQELIDYLKTRY